jgi:Na+-transporting methylmalonyl-CoA/oxaloacetate decarboxylase gamma subunit
METFLFKIVPLMVFFILIFALWFVGTSRRKLKEREKELEAARERNTEYKRRAYENKKLK